MKNVLEVHNLCAFYPEKEGSILNKTKKKQVLTDISFSIQKGEIIGLVGESGSGKSTLARSILGLQKDVTGEVIHSTTHPQMVFQDTYSSLNPEKTVDWLMHESLRMQKVEKDQRERKVVGMLETVGLSKSYRERYSSELSGGQRQRVGIALALLQQPELLVADEPVSALDATIQKQIIDLLDKLRLQKNISILFISHDLRAVYQISDRILIMKNGKIVESGDKNAVYFSPKQDYTRLLLDSAGIDWRS